MPPYKKRVSTTRNNSKTTSADWQGLIYYSIIGILCYIGFMAIRSLSLGTGNKASFADWLKSIFNIFQSGNGGSSSGTAPTTSAPTDNGGFEDIPTDQGTGVDLYAGAIKDYKYFKASEYFGNQPRPTNPQYIANYNKLMVDLDKIRQNYGSSIQIISGYKAGNLAFFQECKGAHIKPVNGNYDALLKVVNALKNTNQISGTIVGLIDDKAIRYYFK